MQREFAQQPEASLRAQSALQQKLNQILTPCLASIELPSQKNLSNFLTNALIKLQNSNLIQQVPVVQYQIPSYSHQQEAPQQQAYPTNEQCKLIQDHLNNMLLLERSRAQMINNFASTLLGQQLNGQVQNYPQMIQSLFNLNYVSNQLNNLNIQNYQNKNLPEQMNFPNILHEQEAENKALREQINSKNLQACEHIHVNKQQIDPAFGSSGANSSTNNQCGDSKANQPNQPPNNFSQSTLRNESTNDPAAYRRMCIERYKRKRRNWTRQVSYECRKVIAEKRLRVKGRFISKSDQQNICQLLHEENVENVFDEKKNLDLMKFQQRVKLFGTFNTKKISKERILTKINDKVHEKEIQELILERIIHKKQLLQIMIEPRVR